jgi:DhnA family fructose-bisphosphate aldolase class Ia
MAQVKQRMNHIFQPDGKTFILAMDHGSNFNVLPALKEEGKMIRDLAGAGADAFLSTIGMAENFQDDFLGKGIILRIDGGVSFLGNHSKPMQIVATAEDALRLGADSVITMSFPGSVFENEVLSNMAKVALDAHKWGIPVTAEALPRGFEKSDDSRTPENITFACRQALELGADIIKTNYTGDQDSFHNLTESVCAPVVILGGAKKVPEEELLQEIKDALDAGAAGVAMGRNIWGDENPIGYAAAIAKLIHEGCSVEAALKEKNKMYKVNSMI